MQYKLSVFNHNSLTLYNAKYDGKLKGKRSTHKLYKNSIIKYWTENTDPSPSHQDNIIISRDEHENAIRHQRHSVRETQW